MSDQGKWAKLWTTVLADPELENLELHQWARWVRLLIFIKAHGTDGKLMITKPCRSLQNTLRMSSFEELISLILVLPSFKLLDTWQENDPSTGQFITVGANAPRTVANLDGKKSLPLASHTALQETEERLKRYMLVVKNWNKYQGDFSVERVRKHRAKNSVTGSVTGNGESNGLRREEKRRDVTSTSFSSPKPPARSGPSAPLAGLTKVDQEDMPEFDHEDFKMAGWINSAKPDDSDSFGWDHFNRAMTEVERVQSKTREKYYAQKKHWN